MYTKQLGSEKRSARETRWMDGMYTNTHDTTHHGVVSCAFGARLKHPLHVGMCVGVCVHGRVLACVC